MNHDKFPIPAGLRPLRIVRSDEEAPFVAPQAPQRVPEEEEKDHRPKFLEASRDYYLNVARKMKQSRAMRLPPPRPVFCCCLRAPKVKEERTGSGLELSKLLLVRNDPWV